MTLTLDPAWPWSSGGLLLVGLLLAALAVWSYRQSGLPPQRLALALGLRLVVVLLAVLALLRPALAFREDLRAPSVLVVACDSSESMTIQDEFDGLSRWEYLTRLLRRAEPTLARLQDERNIQVVFHRFAADVRDLGPAGDARADGKRSDYGGMLQALYERYRGERHLRGLLVLGDGTDNGTRHAALPLAAQWRNLPCPVHAFAFGKPTTGDRQADIAFTDLTTEPAPVVPIKGKLTLRALVDAPGFENRTVRARLFFDDREAPVLVGDKEAPFQEEALRLTTGNELRVVCNAPAKAGEVKVTLKIEPQRDELAAFNNEISTYVTVSKEGLSVLLVDKARAWEPVYISRALAGDPRIRLYDVAFRNSREAPDGKEDLYHFGERAYDVVILGDVTPGQVAAGGPRALATLRDMVQTRGVGLLFLGGFNAFSPAWKSSELGPLFPTELPDGPGQVEGKVRLGLTERGKAHFLVRLVDDATANLAAWEKLEPLDGMNRLGPLRPGTNAEVLVQSAPGGEPVLAARDFGAGRVLAFAGDTTWRWVRPPDGHHRHARFWKQLVLWLARQEEAQGSAWVRPDARRLPAGAKLGFAAGLRGKGGLDLKEARFEAKVVGPDGTETVLTTARDKEEERGNFWKTDRPGEYRVIVKATGKDGDGAPVTGEAAARFLVTQEDTEMARRAADHDFLRRLASSGGGTFHRADADEFGRFLDDIGSQPLPQVRPKTLVWPEWRRGALSAFLPLFFVLFVTLVSLEWFLRRRWGMV